ncbi:MAG: LCP family protein [Endomicrobiia bacterium]|nr:LCP family protein [Endomicrobiia bacterium]
MKQNISRYALTVFAVILVVSIIMTGRNPVSRALSLRGDRKVNILLMGMDAVEASKHTDTLMLLNYSVGERVLNIIAIPRDTLVRYEGGRPRRINEIYALMRHKTSSDREAAREFLNFVNNNLFSGQLEIRHYVQVDYEFFTRLVDILGKIRVEISEPMKYDDFAGNLHIDFSTGVRHLDGKEALKYIRYRGKGSDIRRIARQQKFIVDWFKSARKPLIFLQLPRIVSAFAKNTNTNIGLWGIAGLMFEFRGFETDNIRFFTLPGKFYSQYWQYNPAAAEENIFKIIAATRAPRETTYLVEVWNASGKTGAARAARDALIKSGFNVVEWGNYSVYQQRTVINNMCEEVSAGLVARNALGSGDIINRYDASRTVDISIIIGEDYEP